MKLIYVGDGFLPGIPARDLTDEEVEAHGGAASLIATGLYQAEDSKPAAGKKAAKDGE
jgi:hypothetical protein